MQRAGRGSLGVRAGRALPAAFTTCVQPQKSREVACANVLIDPLQLGEAVKSVAVKLAAGSSDGTSPGTTDTLKSVS